MGALLQIRENDAMLYDGIGTGYAVCMGSRATSRLKYCIILEGNIFI